MKNKLVFSIILITSIMICLLLIIVFFDSRKVRKPRLSGAMEALNFWTRARAYPQKDIPPDRFFKAFRQSETALNKSSQLLDDTTSWKAMGPNNVPGRMISLAVNPLNPSTLYAGSASGGLWRTHSAETGENWERISTGYPTLGVMAIVIDPTDTNTMYIGTGEVYGYKKSIGGFVIRTTRGSYGIGILKTTDGCKTWVKSLDWTYHQDRGVQCLRMNPLNPNTLYAATSEGIYKTVDAGLNWNLVLPVTMGEDIVIHPSDTSKVMVSCGNLGSPGSGIYRTTDAGKYWIKLDGIPSFSGKTLLEMYAANPNIVFASVADSLNGIGLYRTDNFGTTWIVVHTYDVPQYQGWFSHWVAVHPSNLNQIVHAGVQIYKSNNGGQRISQIYGAHVDHHNYAHDPTNPNILYIACDGGVYRTTNFGNSYEDIGYGLQTAQFYNGFSSSYSDSLLAMGGLQDNSTVIYYGTKDWTIRIGGDGCWTAINSFDDNILYGEYQYNNILKSSNRGTSFLSATTGMTGAGAAFVAPFIISPSNPYILFSGRRQVYKTTNAANNWFATNNGYQLDGNSVLSMAISATNPDIVYVGTAPTITRAHIFCTTNGGESWLNVTESLPDRYPMDLAVDPNDDQIVYAVFGGFGSGHVFKSMNRGESWQDITSTLPDVPTLAIAIDPLNSDHIYVGNDLGVYVSTDRGTSWACYSNSLPESVIAMDLNISIPNRKLRLATHGNGAYQRDLVYKPTFVLVFNFDPIPSIVLINTELLFTASVTNQGTKTQTDSFSVKLRVLNDLKNEVFADTKTFCCLEPKESLQLELNRTFIPRNPGNYTIEFIKLGTIQNPEQDTTRQIVTAISLPTIAEATVTKQYYPYNQITVDKKLPKGDDIQASAVLPFSFIFDGFEYDKVQISTNGWVEFGTGQYGTERGLSTVAQIGQIGANENGRLATTARPNKALGPWWEDLNTDVTGITGEVGYATFGSAPNRIFVIQWKNMRAYYDDATTTTRVNFQVRLYESTHIIEYHYGPVVSGTFAGPDIGAMIGFKDHIGGDYHFYDIIAGGTRSACNIITNLCPLTDWPGPDSCYVIQTAITSVAQKETTVPKEISLYQNYPNPFNSTTTIRYSLPQTAKVILKIYNSLGQEVRTLVDEIQEAGFKSIVWDGKSNQGNIIGSGMYLYRMQIGEYVQSRKILYLK